MAVKRNSITGISPLKLLVLVPHQDDELNIAGQVLPTFLDAGYDCRICFSTNGDGFKSNGPVRLKEAIKVAECFGVGRDNLIFLGFDDSLGPDHPYNRVADGAALAAPLTKTYADAVVPYSEARDGKPLPQCRETLVADVAHLLSEWRPDTVLCVDYDSHPDHRALSLAFEEALGQVMRRDRSYRPLVLKKFAYPSVWYGPVDYWDFAPTVRPERCGEFELDNPMYAWEDRVRVAPHPSAITRHFFANAVVKAAMRYPSQNGWFFMASVCNADVVYWVRRTDNLILDAEVVSSSGDVTWLGDFRLFDSTDVCSNDALALADRCFRFEEGDVERAVRIMFDGPRLISEVIVRECVGSFGAFVGACVSFDGLAAIAIPRSEIHPGRFALSLDEPIVACAIELKFAGGGDVQAVASVEIYSTLMNDYELLGEFENLAGEPREIAPARIRPGWVLRQAARVTGKVAFMKLKRRERRNAK